MNGFWFQATVNFKSWRIDRLFLLCGRRNGGKECAKFDLKFIITQYVSSVSVVNSLGLDLIVRNEEDEIWQSPFLI